MEQKDFFRILEKYRLGNASVEEKKLIDAWYEALGQNAGEVSNPNVDELATAYWTSIESKISEQEAVELQKRRIYKVAHSKYPYGIAASLIIAAAIIFYLTSGNKIIKTESLTQNNKENSRTGWTQLYNREVTTQRYILSDGSSVTLKPKSSIKLGPDFNIKTREIYLEGEALFQVAHDQQRPFLVYANGIVTKVLGTSFIVRAFQQEKNVVVSVNTGKVSVYNSKPITEDQKAEIILTPNQQIIYNKKQETISRGIVQTPQPVVEPEAMKRMRFEGATVTEIFGAIEKAYGIKIEFDSALVSCRLTTSISDGGLYNRLSIITRAIGAEYTVAEDKIVVTGPGCN